MPMVLVNATAQSISAIGLDGSKKSGIPATPDKFYLSNNVPS